MVHFVANDLEQQITKLGMNTVLVATIVLIGCTLTAIYLNKTLKKKDFKRYKLPLFLAMAFALVGSTALLFGSTVYLNTKAESKGPVHWHADIEFWACGTELELRDPTGFLSNKIGTATYHEHNDKRIHLEGVVVKKAEDASLEKFMRVTGGYINDDAVGIPLNTDGSLWTATENHQDGDKQETGNFPQYRQFITEAKNGAVLELKNGNSCNGKAAEVQAFIYKFDKVTDTYVQEKLTHPGEYIMRDQSIVPPGDCVIVEFDVPKDRTDKLCQQYGVRDKKRCVAFGVEEFNPDLCNIREVNAVGGEL